MRRQDYEQVELLLAARFPRPDVRDLIRRLPVPHDAAVRAPEPCAPHIGSDGSAVQSALPPTQTPMATQTVRRALEPLSADRFGVHFTADAEFLELLEAVRALASHRQPNGDLMTLMKRGLESYRRELQKQRLAWGENRGACEKSGVQRSKPRQASVPVTSL